MWCNRYKSTKMVEHWKLLFKTVHSQWKKKDTINMWCCFFQYKRCFEKAICLNFLNVITDSISKDGLLFSKSYHSTANEQFCSQKQHPARQAVRPYNKFLIETPIARFSIFMPAKTICTKNFNFLLKTNFFLFKTTFDTSRLNPRESSFYEV